MKTLRQIGMAVLAVVMCVNFTACSDDDEPNTGNENQPPLGKRLSKVHYVGGSEDWANEFSYNSDGKLNQIKFVWDYGAEGTGEDVISVNYSEDKITYSEDDYSYTFLLTDGRVSTWQMDDNEPVDIFYNENGNLVNYDSESLTWNNGNCSSFAEYDFTYFMDKENKHFNFIPALLGAFDGSEILFAHPELLGTQNKNLLKSYSDGYNTYNCSYKFDNDEYITEIVVTSSNGRSETYTFTWE